MEFLKTHKVALTPLSPIHIGCGEDFEPTNYVIDAEQKLLYGFDPSRAALPEDVIKNLESCCVSSKPLARLHRDFFLGQYKKKFTELANVLVAVTSEVGKEYTSRLNGDFNQFIIERHVHQAYGKQLPYIPGSALKGVMRTGLLNKLMDDAVEPVTADMETNLLRGNFQKSPLRLLKVSDLMPVPNTESALLTANYRYKDGLPHNKKLPPLIKESLLPGQYRALMGEIVLQDLGDKGNTGGIPALRPDVFGITKNCHDYHWKCWRKEMDTLCQNGLADTNWMQVIDRILSGKSLAQCLKEGSAMLIRLGRYGGAESKTLPRVANIKIHKNDYRKETTTCWLARENGILIPFGWALIEIDPQDDLPELKTWCEAQSKNRLDMSEKYATLAADRAKAEQAAVQQKAEREAKLAAERQAEEDRAKAEAERKARLAELSEASQQVELYKEFCAQREQAIQGRKGNAYGSDYQQAKKLADEARAGEAWSAADKQAAAEAIENWLPRLERLEAKEARKKLKLSELRENV